MSSVLSYATVPVPQLLSNCRFASFVCPRYWPSGVVQSLCQVCVG